MTRRRHSSSVSAYTESSASAASDSSTRNTTTPSTALPSPVLPSNQLPNLDQQLHEDGKPKRPMNVFLVYSRWRRESGNLPEEFEGTPRSEWSTRLGKEWKSLPSSERAKWGEHYDQLRKRFDQLFPDYVYTRSSRRQSAGASAKSSRSKKFKSKARSATSTSKTVRPKDRGDSYSPPKKAWINLSATRTSIRRTSAPEYREKDDSPLSEEEDDLDGNYEIEVESSPAPASQPRGRAQNPHDADSDDSSDEEEQEHRENSPTKQPSGPRPTETSGLGLMGMSSAAYHQQIDSPTSTVDAESGVSTGRATPINPINYESAPPPKIPFASSSLRLQSSFEDSYRYNQLYNQIWPSGSASSPFHSGEVQPYHQPAPVAPHDFLSYDYNRY